MIKLLLFHIVDACYVTYTLCIFNFDSMIIYLLYNIIYLTFHLLLLASRGNSYAKIFGVEMILILDYGGNYLSMVGVSYASTAQSKFWHCTVVSSGIIILKQHW